MKVAKTDNTKVEFKVWCESCNIRVAPNEERTVVRGKIYHPTCYSKTSQFAAEIKTTATGS
jgi:hypothetical protein